MKKFLKRLAALASAAALSAALAVAPASAGQNDFAPVNFIATGRDRSLSVSWTNPGRDDIVSMKLYDSAGNMIYEANEEQRAANAVNFYSVGSLSNGTVYTYDLKVEYADGSTYNFGCVSNKLNDLGVGGLWGGSSGNKGTHSFNSWTESVAGAAAARFFPQKEVVRTGENALCIQRNRAYTSNNYQQFAAAWKDPEFAYDAEKRYMAEFYYKRVNMDGIVKFVHEKDINSYKSIEGLKNGSDAEWQRFEKIMKGKDLIDKGIDAQKHPVRLAVERPVENLYIDDFGVYEIDGENNKISDNLIVNGGFEEGDTIASYDVGGLSYDYNEQTGQMTLNWTNPAYESSPDKNFFAVKIYRFVDGVKYLAKATKGNTASFSDVLKGEKFIVSVIDDIGNESGGITVFAVKPFMPKSLIAVGRTTDVSVSWVNPDRDDITSVELYDDMGNLIASDSRGLVSNNAAALKDSGEYNISREAGAANYVRVTGLNQDNAGAKYIYNLKITYSDETKYNFAVISNKLVDYNTGLYGGSKGAQSTEYWFEAVNGEPYARIEIQDEVAYEGKAAVKIRRNVPGIRNNFQQLAPVWADSGFDYDDGKTYRLEYYYMITNGNGSNARSIYKGDANTDYTGFGSSVSDWKYVYSDVNGSALPEAQKWPFRFSFHAPFETAYIDGVGVYELDENGNKTGENLLKDGGFELGDLTPPSEAADVYSKYDEYKKELTVGWSKGSDDTENMYVYAYSENGEEYLTCITGKDSVLLGGVNEGDSFRIAAADEAGNETAGVYVTAEKEIRPVEITDFEIADNGDGSYTARAVITNNKGGNDFNPCLYIASYINDEALYGVNIDCEIIEEGGQITLSADISIPTDDFVNSYTVKAFLWDDVKPLSAEVKRIDV